MELSWSRWFRCESSFGLLLVPPQPGIFALAEEVGQPAGANSRRMLAVFEIKETENVAHSLSRLFSTGNPWQERLKTSSFYLRYALVADAAKRRSAVEALRNWLSSQMDAAAHVFEQARGSEMPQEAATVAERAVDRVMAAKAISGEA